MGRKFFGIVLLAALQGCVESEMIVLKNPATGDIKECSKNSGPSFFPSNCSTHR